jgi:hypothetical protein
MGGGEAKEEKKRNFVEKEESFLHSSNVPALVLIRLMLGKDT